MYNGAETYFENGVLSADPVELVRMLYRGCIDAVEKARQHLREGDIAARSAQITRAGAIVAHLTFSVNRDADPTMGANLIELYDYMQRRLLRANLEQADGPLAEVSRLLSTMLEAWAACGPVEAGAVQAMPTWAPAEPEPVEMPGAGVYGQTVGASPYAEAAGGGLYGQAFGADAYAGTAVAGSFSPTVGGAYGQAVDAGVYAGAGPAETAGAGAYSEPASAGAYGQPVDAGVYSPTVGAGAYGQPVDFGVYSPTAGAGAYGQPADFGVYSPTSGAGAYAQTSGAGAYAQTGAAGGYGEEEREVEYAGKSWDF